MRSQSRVLTYEIKKSTELLASERGSAEALVGDEVDGAGSTASQSGDVDEGTGALKR
jgi:hypothetical protein